MIWDGQGAPPKTFFFILIIPGSGTYTPHLSIPTLLLFSAITKEEQTAVNATRNFLTLSFVYFAQLVNYMLKVWIQYNTIHIRIRLLRLDRRKLYKLLYCSRYRQWDTVMRHNHRPPEVTERNASRTQLTLSQVSLRSLYNLWVSDTDTYGNSSECHASVTVSLSLSEQWWAVCSDWVTDWQPTGSTLPTVSQAAGGHLLLLGRWHGDGGRKGKVLYCIACDEQNCVRIVYCGLFCTETLCYIFEIRF